jgi:serine/threonine-protein kinase Chk1
MKHDYILEFLYAEIVDKDKEGDGWVPGLYMLLELAAGGDLFDKIGELSI